MTISFDGDRPMTWVPAIDPRFRDFAARYKAERGVTPSPMRSKWVSGDNAGWFFSTFWVDASYRKPLSANG